MNTSKIDNNKFDLHFKELNDVKNQLKLKEIEIKRLEEYLKEKNERIIELENDFERFKKINTQIQRKAARGIGISAESQEFSILNESAYKSKRIINKEKRTKECLVRALLENDFIRKLSANQISEIVDYMYPVAVNRGDWIIQEGEIGSSLYAIEEGTIEIIVKGDHLRDMATNSIFGELAILYNCTRTASVKAKTKCKLWAIERHSFKSILMKSGLKRQEDFVKFLKSVPTFKSLSMEKLIKISDVLNEVHYHKDEYIIREGALGDTFYIISQGKVKVTKRNKIDSHHENVIRYLERGQWFGEKALQDEDVRTANIIAVNSEGVDCLVLDRESYNLLIRDIADLHICYEDEKVEQKTREIFSYLQLKDLCFIGTIGIGGFGRVDLVQIGKDRSQSFALKKMKKYHIAQMKQQEHVKNERSVMLEIETEFIVKLYKTFRDKKYIYLLMELCPGGEVWSLLRDRKSFNESTSRFYVSCTVMALEYLHRKGIVYRDIKPENLVLDSYGYCKLTDFGFSKKIGFLNKTWTFCGTPEYVAPEIVLNKGHDFSVDFWSLGILLFELLTGTPPFSTGDPMKTYSVILKGIEAIEVPSYFSKNVYNIIKKLARDNPSERLGYGKKGVNEIKKHVWFEGFNWEGLISKTFQPPLIPKIKSTSDTSNFDNYPPDEDIPLDDMGGWDKEFEM